MRGFLSKQKTTLLRIGGALAGCVLLLALANALPQSVKERVTGNTLARQFLPLYRSLRKLPDILFTPYLAAPNRLPRWSLTIAPEDILYQNSRLPTTSPFTSILLDSGRVFVDASFSASAYEPAKVEVRYKGLNANHWNSFQKSYRVRFPGDRLFEMERAVSLTIPYDKRYYAELLNTYRARKFGLLAPDTRLVNLALNDQNHGVYLASEHWTKELVAKHRVPDDSILFGANDGSEALISGPEAAYQNVFSLFSRDDIAGWKSYTHALPSYDELETLLEIISYADDATFRLAIPRILDMEAFYKWNIINVLAGNDGSDFENLVLLFNTATGLFELVPFDISYGTLQEPYRESSTLARRILAMSEFRAARNALLEAYVSDAGNLRDDLAYYDTTHRSARTAFFQDNAKRDTNFTFLAQVSDVRKAVEENFTKARAALATAYPPPPVAARPLRFADSFSRFAETYETEGEFLAHNPEFVKESEYSVALLPGEHVFSRTVIVPAGLELVIYPNATLCFDADISLVSYSPVVARGLDGALIRIERCDPARQWGSLVVQNTGERESIFEYVRISGGSGAHINGVTFTGMVALHKANASISDSFFANSGDDDAINPRYGRVTITRSVFENTFSDAIDMDFAAPESRIEGNAFRRIGTTGGKDIGGDAIDISWSDISVRKNTVSDCTDKGISVGENSHPWVEDNTIRRCDMGVAVKDSSRAEIVRNAIAGARIGIAAYRKKDVFDGGNASVSENIITDTETPYAADTYSRVYGAAVVAPYTPAMSGQSPLLP